MTRDSAPSLRLFVAIELPDEVRNALASAMEMLKRAGATTGLRWVRPEGVHVTLQFLGATEIARVPPLEAALHDAVRGALAFDLAPGGLGSFGGRARMRVVWLALGGDDGALAALAQRVVQATAPLGFASREGEFNAHLTLARIRDDAPRAERERLHDLITGYEPPTFPPLHVDHISLIQSTLARGGAVYRTLSTYALLK